MQNILTIQKDMRKLSFIPLFLLGLFTAAPAYADIPVSTCPGGGFAAICLSADRIGSLIGNAINLIFVAAAILALIFLIIGGVKWLTSQGEKEGVTKARETIVAAVVGLVIVFLSYIIINFLLNLFVGVNLASLSFPSLIPH